MRRIAALFLSLLLFCACASPASSEAQQIAASATSSSPSEEGSAGDPLESKDPLPALSGKIVNSAMIDTSFSRGHVLGTEGDKKNFDLLLGDLSQKTTSLVLAAFDAEERKMTSQEAENVFSLLINADYRVFTEQINPATGGMAHLFFYDEGGNCLLHAGYDGAAWLILDFGDEMRVFDGSDCGLETLFDIAFPARESENSDD